MIVKKLYSSEEGKKNYEIFLDKFIQTDSHSYRIIQSKIAHENKKTAFSIIIFLLPLPWLLYRKLYNYSILYFIIYIFLEILFRASRDYFIAPNMIEFDLSVFYSAISRLEFSALAINPMVILYVFSWCAPYIILSIYFSLFGRSIYLKKAETVFYSIFSKSLSTSNARGMIHRKGGVAFFWMLLILIAFYLIYILIHMLLWFILFS